MLLTLRNWNSKLTGQKLIHVYLRVETALLQRVELGDPVATDLTDDGTFIPQISPIQNRNNSTSEIFGVRNYSFPSTSLAHSLSIQSIIIDPTRLF